MNRKGVSSMATEFKPLDISDTPELARLVEEVRASREPRVLRRHGEDLAVLTPVSTANPRRATRAKGDRRKTTLRAEAIARSRAGILAAAGSWKELDVEAFKRYLRERRETSSRPPVEL
jgi:hypothetical protein